MWPVSAWSVEHLTYLFSSEPRICHGRQLRHWIVNTSHLTLSQIVPSIHSIHASSAQIVRSFSSMCHFIRKMDKPQTMKKSCRVLHIVLLCDHTSEPRALTEFRVDEKETSWSCPKRITISCYASVGHPPREREKRRRCLCLSIFTLNVPDLETLTVYTLV